MRTIRLFFLKVTMGKRRKHSQKWWQNKRLVCAMSKEKMPLKKVDVCNNKWVGWGCYHSIIKARNSIKPREHKNIVEKQRYFGLIFTIVKNGIHLFCYSGRDHCDWTWVNFSKWHCSYIFRFFSPYPPTFDRAGPYQLGQKEKRLLSKFFIPVKKGLGRIRQTAKYGGTLSIWHVEYYTEWLIHFSCSWCSTHGK